MYIFVLFSTKYFENLKLYVYKIKTDLQSQLQRQALQLPLLHESVFQE